ncbi:MAG: chemotaxis protein CheW [Myxococcota bacterium]
MSESLSSSTEARWDVLARAAAARDADAPEEAGLLQLLRFDVAGAPYALPVPVVREIVRLRTITPLPRVARSVRGVISLRGEILQVIDLRERLGLPRGPDTKASRIIVVHDEAGDQAGVCIDAVRDVIRVSEDALRPPVAGDSGDLVESLCAHDNGYVSVLDLGRILEATDG